MTDVFVYHFGYRGKNTHTSLDINNYPPRQVHPQMKYGVGNGDDLIYLFPVLSGTFRPLPHDDLIFSQRFIQLLVSFARTGKPVIAMEPPNRVELDENGGTTTTTTTTTEKTLFEWEPVHVSSATHLDIGNVMKMDE